MTERTNGGDSFQVVGEVHEQHKVNAGGGATFDHHGFMEQVKRTHLFN